MSPPNLVASIEQSALPNYLASVETVDRLLRDFLEGALHRRTIAHADYLPDPARATEADVAAIKRLAEIFLGQSLEYPAPQPWFSADGVAAFMGQQLNIDEQDPALRLQSAFAMWLTGFYDAVNQLQEPHAQTRLWHGLIEAMIEEWRNLLLGIPREVLE